MVCELVGGWGFWIGDGGGAGGSPGEYAHGTLGAVDAVIELSDWGLDDREEFVVVVGIMVSARSCVVKRPLLSWVMYF